MLAYIVRRLLAIVPVMFGVATIIFFLMNVLPGDPTDVLLANMGGGSTLATKGFLRQRLGLDRPLYSRFADNLGSLAHGDLGSSIITGQRVAELLGSQISDTVELATVAIVAATLAGLLVGVAAAVKANSRLDAAVMGLTYVAISVPSFLLGLLLLMLFSYDLGWTPIISSGGSAAALVLPAAALAVPAAASIARVTRSAMLDVIVEPYISTAKAKGLTSRTVFGKHALRNALISTTTLVGLYFGYLITGTVVVETVFARRGIGRVLIGAILQRDFPVVQAVVLLGALAFIVVNLLVDVLNTWLDPRISYA